MPVCDETTRFVDNHIITVDLDPETERNVRQHERSLTLDDAFAALTAELGHPGPGLYAEDIQIIFARLRPGSPLDG